MLHPTRLPTRPASTAIERRLRQAGYRLIAGVDEVGRGCLAGPVVAAAVIMPEAPRVPHVNDSKLLPPPLREQVAEALQATALTFGIGVVSAAQIDCTDILRATHVAMRMALEQLAPPPDFILLDGRPVPNLPAPSEAVVGGDRLSYSIAAASIIAKVYRDRVMTYLEALYPGYGLGDHKGYLTAEHREAIENLGPCPVHRLTFEPLKSRAQGRFEL